MNSEFGSLKPDSVIDIFNVAVSASKLTRAELAERCGLSVMTVGKAADALVSVSYTHLDVYKRQGQHSF